MRHSYLLPLLAGLLLTACQTDGSAGGTATRSSNGSSSTTLPGNYIRLGGAVLDDAGDLKDLAAMAGAVAGAADACALQTDMMDKEVRELSDLIPDFGAILPKGGFAGSYQAARKGLAGEVERGGCENTARAGVERIYANVVIDLQSPRLRSWIRELKR